MEEHAKPCIQERRIVDQEKRLESIERAMFGDKELKTLGVLKMTTDMYKVLVEGGVVKKTITWAFATIMAIGSIILMYLQIIKESRKN